MQGHDASSPDAATIRDEPAHAGARGEERRLHPVFDCILDGVVMLDLEGGRLLLNAAAERIFGREGDGAGSWPADCGLFLPDQTTPYPTQDLPMNRALRGETVERVEIFVRNARIPDGAWYEVNASPWVDSLGAPQGAITVLRETTRHKLADEEVARLASAVEQTADSVVITDAKGEILYVNRGFEAITGYSRSEVIGRTPAMLKSGRHDAVFYRGMWRTILGGDVFRGTLVNQRKNGDVYYAEQTITPLRNASGAISSFVSVGKDVTELRQAQERELEMRLAGRVQQRLYPRRAPSLPGFDIAGAALPSTITCGDYFDFLTLPDHVLGLVIADVSGHGLGPALVMAETRALLRSCAQTVCEPGTVLERVDRALLEDLESGSFVTLLLARLDVHAWTLTYANAGHPYGYVLDRRGRLRHTLESTRAPLGVDSRVHLPEPQPIRLAGGDLLVLITDGVLEAQEPGGEFFGAERVLALVREHRSRPAREILDQLFRVVAAFRQGAPQTDDLTAVICKVGR